MKPYKILRTVIVLYLGVLCGCEEASNTPESTYVKNGYLNDSIELSDGFIEIEEELHSMILEELKQMDFVDKARTAVYWHVKKRILKERFGIKWRSPFDLNPSLKISG